MRYKVSGRQRHKCKTCNGTFVETKGTNFYRRRTPDKRISASVSPSPVRVTSDQAHNLALVINELATNAAKHASGEGEHDTAQITVQIALDEDGMVRCEFRDDGPGYPEDVLRLERHNVGLDLIKNIVCQSLRGELSLHNDHGAVTIIRFKKATDSSQ